jgi:hypothetical protein
MRKCIITTGCDPREPWTAVHALTFPRFKKYGELHGYDFKPIWYQDIHHDVFKEFYNPGPFVDGAVNYGVRQDFIRWKMNRNVLAPNWLRYAAIMQMLDGYYDLVVYFDGDLVVGDFSTDFMAEVPADKWLACPLNGPSPDNAGPGGPLLATRSCPASLDFWRRVWFARKWITHEWWTDGVDFMDLLGFTITPPIHKERVSEYDPFVHYFPMGMVDWFDTAFNPGAKFYHPTGGGSGAPERKVGQIENMIRWLEK